MNDESHKDPDSMAGHSPSPASEAAAPRRPRKRKSAEGALQEDAAVPQLSGADGAQSDVKM
ncbi:MAG: 23S rRNA pseudouridylate synthase B, partial [Acidovorax sp.]|nr:23S rRNA pseudouridylate synthase B [Acidovorax sp.]